MQVKCTSQQLLDNDFVKFPLLIKNYDELRNDNPDDDPLLLVVVLIPDLQEDWLQQSETELCLKRCVVLTGCLYAVNHQLKIKAL